MRAALERWLPAGSFARSVGVLTGGTAFAQGLALLALPLLTRLYSPEDFALLAVYVAIIGIATVVSCLRYNIAIPLPDDDADGMALLAVSLVATSLISALLAMPVLFAPAQTAAVLGQPGLATYLWMIPLGVFFASAYNALQYWASRRKRFSAVARTRMTQAIGSVTVQAGFGVAQVTPFGLLFGSMMAQGLGMGRLLRTMISRDREIAGCLSRNRFLKNLYDYKRYPTYSVPEALFNTAGVQLPVILIAAAAAPEAGFLMLAMRAMGLPARLVGGSVAQVFIAEAPARLQDGTLVAFTRTTMRTLLRTGAPPLVAVGALSPLLFPLVFGAEWAPAGWLVAWMTPWFVLQFVASPVSMVLHVSGRVGLAMGLQAFGFLLRLCVVLSVSFVEPTWMAESYAVINGIFYLTYFAVIKLVLTRI